MKYFTGIHGDVGALVTKQSLPFCDNFTRNIRKIALCRLEIPFVFVKVTLVAYFTQYLLHFTIFVRDKR
jgi:hypothetical protein